MRSLPARLAGAVLLLAGLACGGGPGFLGGGEEDDPAEAARRASDFHGAEQIVRARLDADRTDARSWRLLGDIQLTRGQFFPKRWKQNLSWAVESWEKSLKHDPSDCGTWARLAAVTTAAAENEEVALAPERIGKLPLEAGWEACPGAALLALEAARPPAEPGRNEARYAALTAAAPHWQQAWSRIDTSGWSWRSEFDEAEPGSGWFAILDTPTQAAGVGGASARQITEPEAVQPAGTEGRRVVFLDARFPVKVSASGRVKATACPTARWDIEGPDNRAAGWCGGGAHNASKSPVYDPDRLQPAGPAHYEYSTINLAVVPTSAIVGGTVRCTTGNVGRMFLDVPSCEVSYQRWVSQRRSVPRSAGRYTADEDHARRTADARGFATLYGEEVAKNASSGKVAVGMPYTLFRLVPPSVGACTGRALFQRLELDGDRVVFECPLAGRTYRFEDLVLAEVSDSD